MTGRRFTPKPKHPPAPRPWIVATFEEFVGLYNEWIREQRERGKIEEPFPDWLKRRFGTTV